MLHDVFLLGSCSFGHVWALLQLIQIPAVGSGGPGHDVGTLFSLDYNGVKRGALAGAGA